MQKRNCYRQSAHEYSPVPLQYHILQPSEYSAHDINLNHSAYIRGRYKNTRLQYLPPTQASTHCEIYLRKVSAYSQWIYGTIALEPSACTFSEKKRQKDISDRLCTTGRLLLSDIAANTSFHTLLFLRHTPCNNSMICCRYFFRKKKTERH